MVDVLRAWQNNNPSEMDGFILEFLTSHEGQRHLCHLKLNIGRTKGHISPLSLCIPLGTVKSFKPRYYWQRQTNIMSMSASKSN